MTPRPGAHVAALTWPEVEARLTAGAAAVVPIGAAAKQHGPHLPMNTDLVQAQWLAENLASRHNVLVWPAINYGYYPAFVDYPGSCSIPAAAFQACVTGVCACICGAGARAVIVINTGISTIPPVEDAVAEIAAHYPHARIALANIYHGARYAAVEQRVQAQASGGHADEIETSIMLAMRPEMVDMTRAEAWDQRAFVRGRFQRTAPDQPNYTPSGIYGDATRATRDKGRELVAAMVADLDDILADVQDQPA